MPYAKLSPQYTLYYLDENPSGKAAIFLFHGLGANSNSWQMQIPDLVHADYRVVAPDAPGFGQSSNPLNKTSIVFTSNLFSGLIDHLGLRRVVVAGISMGGTHALQLALDYPARVEKLVLINTFSSMNPANPKVLPYYALRFLLIHTMGLEAQAKSVAKRIFPKPEQEVFRREYLNQISTVNPRTYRKVMRTLARFNVKRRLAEIRCPTLVISGENDTTVPLKTQSKLVENIHGATHRIIPGAGHAVSIEQPETFNQILLEFIKQPVTHTTGARPANQSV